MSKRKRKPTRKLYPSEILRRLESIEGRWPLGLSLFAWNDTLILIKDETSEVLGEVYISCDGGDPRMHKENGKKYLDFS